MSKTLTEASEEFDEALSAVRRELEKAVVASLGFRLFVRFAEWVDAKVPALRWLDDKTPRWLHFPSWAFFEALGTLYLGIIIGGLIWSQFFR